MATYREAESLIRQLKPIIDREIDRSPVIRSAIKVQKAVVWAAPDTVRHTVAVKFLPDLFNKDVDASTFPYSPTLLETDLQKGKTVYVFYYQSLSNGVVMQNATWTAGGSGGDEGGVDSVNGKTGTVTLTATDLGIAEWAQAPSKPSYSWDEISGKPNIVLTSDLEGYVTTNTPQTISGKKTFSETIVCTAKNSSADDFAEYAGDRILFSHNGAVHALSFPSQSGTLARVEDLTNYVTLNTKQDISEDKNFTRGIRVYGGYQENGDFGGILLDDGGNDAPDTRLVNHGLIRTWADWDAPVEIYFPSQSGTLALKEDIPSLTGYVTTSDLEGYAKTADLNNYVTVDTMQDINGEKDFIIGARFGDKTQQTIINGSTITLGQMARTMKAVFTKTAIDFYYVESIGSAGSNSTLRYSVKYPESGGTLALKEDIPSAYTLPQATSSALGGIKIGATGLSEKQYAVQLNTSGQAFVSVPWTDTKADLTDYVTLNTNQSIEGFKYFKSGQIQISPNATPQGLTLNWDSFEWTDDERGEHKINLPKKDGTIALEEDLPNFSDFAKLAANQTFTGTNTFTGIPNFQNGIDIENGAVTIDRTGISFNSEQTLSKEELKFPAYSGTIARLEDIPKLTIANGGSSGNAVTSITVNGHTITVTKGETFATNAGLTSLTTRVTTIEGKIPAQASTSNQLADKSFVNSTIQTATANFRGNWETWAAVPTAADGYPADYAGGKTPTVNDYLVVQDASDYSGKTLSGTWRFKYSGAWGTNGKNGWQPEYQVNETPLTAAQLSALNSGITANGVAQITRNSTDIAAIKTKNTEQDTAIAAVKTTADNAMPKSGGQFTGRVSWNSTSLPSKTTPEYFVTIEPFASGGKTYYTSQANVKSALGVDTAQSTADSAKSIAESARTTASTAVQTISASNGITASKSGTTITVKGVLADTSTVGVAKLHAAANCTSYSSDDGGATPSAVKKAIITENTQLDGIFNATKDHRGTMPKEDKVKLDAFLTADNYLLKSGDTMTGNLTVGNSGNISVLTGSVSASAGFTSSTTTLSTTYANGKIVLRDPTGMRWGDGLEIILPEKKGTIALLDDITGSVQLKVNTTGSGNAITDLSVPLFGTEISAKKNKTFLETSGGTLTASAQIQRAGISKTWVKGREAAIIRTTSAGTSASPIYAPIFSQKSVNGSWEFGAYTGDTAYLNYITDTDYNANNNTQTASYQFAPNKKGIVAVMGDIKWANIPDKPTIPTIPSLSSTISGSGNAITDITVSGHAITATKGSTFALKTDLSAYLPLAGGTMTGTLSVGSASIQTNGYVTGTWLKTTANTHLASAAKKIAVISDGWIYDRTTSEILSDIGAMSKDDLTDYVTLDTEQNITGKKTFGREIVVGDLVSGGETHIEKTSIQIGAGANMRSVIVKPSGLTFIDYGPNYSTPSNIVKFPSQSGTLALEEDLADYATLSTKQTFTAEKSFSNGLRMEGGGQTNPEIVFSRSTSGKYASFDGLNFKKWNSETQIYNTVSLPTLGGTLARTEDLAGYYTKSQTDSAISTAIENAITKALNTPV